MKVRQFLAVVPSSFKTAATALACCAVLIAATVVLVERIRDGRIADICLGLLVGAVIAIWVLCLGYVHADARRRGMPPILWTLIAALIPNLLGFLLYFASRRPIALSCPHCGQAITAEQRFCSWCGHQGSSALSGQAS
jgi:drug/metabolite transporter (DMT)-like permease